MTWLNLALGLVRLAQWLAATLHDAEVFKQGELKAISDALQKADEQVTKALRAGELAEKRARQEEFDPELFRRD